MVPMSGINDKMVSNFNTEATEQWLQYEEAPLLQYLKHCKNYTIFVFFKFINGFILFVLSIEVSGLL